MLVLQSGISIDFDQIILLPENERTHEKDSEHVAPELAISKRYIKTSAA